MLTSPASCRTLAELYLAVGETYADAPACATRLARGQWRAASFAFLSAQAQRCAAALIARGVQPGDRVALFADHSESWFIAHAGIVCAGGVVVPRGSDVTSADIGHICRITATRLAVVADHRVAAKVASAELDQSPEMIFLTPSAEAPDLDQLISDVSLADAEVTVAQRIAALDPQQLATVIFTSATTGVPKGVQLTHANLIAQLDQIAAIPLPVGRHDRVLSLLPVWHIFELTVSLFALRTGACTWFTSPRHLADDLVDVQPTFLASAPRVWENLYQRIRRGVRQAHPIRRVLFTAASWCSLRFRYSTRVVRGNIAHPTPPPLVRSVLTRFWHACRWLLLLVPHGLLNTTVLERLRMLTGGCLRGTVSGGGALAPEVDAFFNTIGIPIWEGYGMTEAPVIAVRQPSAVVLGTVGPVVPQTEVRLADPESGEIVTQAPQCSKGAQGEIQVRGAQVTAGYYHNDTATAAASAGDGWWRTGDLGRVMADGALQIVGRCKDTIVLASGENVEPVPLEDRLRLSPLIEHAIVVGQDKRQLGLLVVPDREALAAAGHHGGYNELASNEAVTSAVRAEVQRLITRQQGFKAFELIGPVALLPKSLEVGVELTNLLKLRRHIIAEVHATIIDGLYPEAG